MSSAHYQALEPQTSDEDHEDIERQRHRSVPYTMGRKGSVSAGRRRCLLLAGAVIFIVAFCYLTFSMDTRLALGLGGGSDDSDEHHGLGKKRFTRGKTTVVSTSTTQVPKVNTTKFSWFENDWEVEEEVDDEETTPIAKIKASQEFVFSRTETKVNQEESKDDNPDPPIDPQDPLAFKRNPNSINFRPLNETLHICSESYEDRRLFMQDKPRSEYEKLPVIYFVTPTYPRREQIPELTRLAHTLLHVPRLHWLVADDQENCNTYLDTLLNRFGIPFTHMVSPMPSKFRNEKPAPRGVANRRAALQWLKTHNLTNGVLYFGDDDNTYDLRLFSEIRKTQIVSMFPVGLIADYGISGPVVRKGKVVAFLDSWVAGRRWPVDMAGFAVNLEYMAKYPYVNMPYKPGYEEDLFLRSIGLRMDLIEPRGSNCTEVLVWHTQTKSKKIGTLRMESKYMDDRSNLGALLHNLKTMGVALISEDEGGLKKARINRQSTNLSLLFLGRNALISKNGKEKPHSLILS
ncbi:hypothetical protein KR026_002210 [Drosophila bipectinata]|nr:hypothetical protein KR026_002210 [Drosophila bipectinata]